MGTKRSGAATRWRQSLEFAVVFGTMPRSTTAGFIGIGAANLYLKIVVEILTFALMIALGLKVRR